MRLTTILEAVYRLTPLEFAMVMQYRADYADGTMQDVVVSVKSIRAITRLCLKDSLDLLREGHIGGHI